VSESRKWIVRALLHEDRPVWDVHWQGYLTFYRHDLAEDVTDDVFARLISGAPEFTGLGVADSDGRLVGFAHYVLHPSTWTKGLYCYLEDLYVDPSVRGGGAARSLIEELYRRADANGWTRVYWNTEHHNTRARTLYDQVATLTDKIIYERN